MIKVTLIIPVSMHEPLETVKSSLLNLKKLKVPNAVNLEFLYVIDINNGDERKEYLKRNGAGVIENPPKSGKARTLNKAIHLTDSDYIGILDIDARPDRNFIIESLRILEENPELFGVSCRRYPTNRYLNRFTNALSMEYIFVEHTQRFFHLFSGFHLFNGPMGLFRGEMLKKINFKGDVICEDLDFLERATLKGYRIYLTGKTGIGEEIPHNIYDYYNQKVRWLYGALTSLRNKLPLFIRSNISWRVKLSWILILASPFFGFIYSPLILLYLPVIFRRAKCLEDVILNVFGGIFLSLFIPYCGLVAMLRFLSGKRIEWKGLRRGKEI